MPAVTDVLLETTLPGHTRRRVWAQPELRSHALLVLTFEHLYAAPPSESLRPDAPTAAETGDLDEVLGPGAAVVELRAVRRAKLDLLTNSINLEYAEKGAGGNTGRLALVFATPETADACFTKIWRRLGDGCQLLPYKRDSWALARGPLGLLAAVLLATAGAALGLSVIEDTASERAAAAAARAAAEPGTVVVVSRSPLEAAVARVKWQWVCALGGVAASAAQVWLYRRLTRPPVSLEVARC